MVSVRGVVGSVGLSFDRTQRFFSVMMQQHSRTLFLPGLARVVERFTADRAFCAVWSRGHPVSLSSPCNDTEHFIALLLLPQPPPSFLYSCTAQSCLDPLESSGSLVLLLVGGAVVERENGWLENPLLCNQVKFPFRAALCFSCLVCLLAAGCWLMNLFGLAVFRADRCVRVCLLTFSVTCLEAKRPSWQKARILHLSSQLEESMFFSGGSMVRCTFFMSDSADECCSMIH